MAIKVQVFLGATFDYKIKYFSRKITLKESTYNALYNKVDDFLQWRVYMSLSL